MNASGPPDASMRRFVSVVSRSRARPRSGMPHQQARVRSGPEVALEGLRKTRVVDQHAHFDVSSLAAAAHTMSITDSTASRSFCARSGTDSALTT